MSDAPLCTDDEVPMTGAPLKTPNDYVYVDFGTEYAKHLFSGTSAPVIGDFTICGTRINGWFRWAQRAMALGKKPYCRECEQIYLSGMQ